MAKTDRELEAEFIQHWENLEKTLRRVSVYQSYKAPLSAVLKFLRAIGLMEYENRWKPLTKYQGTQATLLQPHPDYTLTQGEVNNFKEFADDLQKKLKVFLDELETLETQKS